MLQSNFSYEVLDEKGKNYEIKSLSPETLKTFKPTNVVKIFKGYKIFKVLSVDETLKLLEVKNKA